jgi:hypothetical protein
MNETDHELLKFAAMAAGEWPSPEPFEHVLSRWNPLTDDGDALRLAVKLGIDVMRTNISGPQVHAMDFGVSITEEAGTDPYAATRRAIVRAAAEIGRNMK